MLSYEATTERTTEREFFVAPVQKYLVCGVFWGVTTINLCNYIIAREFFASLSNAPTCVVQAALLCSATTVSEAFLCKRVGAESTQAMTAPSPNQRRQKTHCAAGWRGSTTNLCHDIFACKFFASLTNLCHMGSMLQCGALLQQRLRLRCMLLTLLAAPSLLRRSASQEPLRCCSSILRCSVLCHATSFAAGWGGQGINLSDHVVARCQSSPDQGRLLQIAQVANGAAAVCCDVTFTLNGNTSATMAWWHLSAMGGGWGRQQSTSATTSVAQCQPLQLAAPSYLRRLAVQKKKKSVRRRRRIIVIIMGAVQNNNNNQFNQATATNEMASAVCSIKPQPQTRWHPLFCSTCDHTCCCTAPRPQFDFLMFFSLCLAYIFKHTALPCKPRNKNNNQPRMLQNVLFIFCQMPAAALPL